MSSIIEGYNYDIFISYRQKDNKGDRWVSEFVEALRTELESTFKEEISVYFDINPHDGLLETHDVDESLKDKLRCLVFIPVISRTYCDTKSFAWEHEFKAFVEMASHDHFGLKIKLPGGNVTSRVLPIRIHDLDTPDIKEIEGVLGRILRGIEFIYKEPGIDKPLAPGDDEHKNLNKTKYNIQIIKVAHAIKEIILGMKSETAEGSIEKTPANSDVSMVVEKQAEAKVTVSSHHSKLISSLVLSAILIITGILVFPKIFNQDKFGSIRNVDGKISVAVLPFENLTGDTTLNWLKRGISSLIINGIGNSNDLSVCDDNTLFEVIQSMNQVYTSGISPAIARDIARKAKAETYISGSFHGREDIYWILVNLVNSETGNILWTDKVVGNLKSSAYLDLADSLCLEIKNFLEIKALNDVADFEFREAYPKSAEAYRNFIEGMNLVLNQNFEPGISSLKRALEIDSTFTLASFYIAYANCYMGQMEQARFWTIKAYQNRNRIPMKYQQWIEMWYVSSVSRDLKETGRYCDQLAGSGINTRFFWSDLGVTYCDFLRQYAKAVTVFEKVIEINPDQISDWKFLGYWDRFIMALHKAGNHEREKEVSEMALKILPDMSNYFYYYMSICDLSHGKITEASDHLAKYMSKHKELGTTEASLENNLGLIYQEAGIADQAEMHFSKAHELNPALIYYLARFLIENKKVDEGMKLIEEGLAVRPENGLYLQLKGWGLYNQGKYEEAVKILEPLWENSEDFDTPLYEYLEAAKKAAAGQKRN